MLVPMPTIMLETPLRLIGREARLAAPRRQSAGGSGKLIAAGWQPAHDTESGLAALVQGAPGTDLPRTQHHASGNADAENVEPALAGIEQVRVEQRRQKIFGHHGQCRPKRQVRRR